MSNRLSSGVPRWREIKLNYEPESPTTRAIFSIRSSSAVIRAVSNTILRKADLRGCRRVFVRYRTDGINGGKDSHTVVLWYGRSPRQSLRSIGRTVVG